MVDYTTPRVEVMIDYPGSHFKKGDILSYEEHSSYGSIYVGDNDWLLAEIVDQCHEVFRKLKYWEFLPDEDMPKYVLVHDGLPDCKRGGKAFRVESIESCYFRIDGGYAYDFFDVTPLTEEEYNNIKEKAND